MTNFDDNTPVMRSLSSTATKNSSFDWFEPKKLGCNSEMFAPYKGSPPHQDSSQIIEKATKQSAFLQPPALQESSYADSPYWKYACPGCKHKTNSCYASCTKCDYNKDLFLLAK
jgi:hypothetical protein